MGVDSQNVQKLRRLSQIQEGFMDLIIDGSEVSQFAEFTGPSEFKVSEVVG